jgi:hypothetical protein
MPIKSCARPRDTGARCKLRLMTETTDEKFISLMQAQFSHALTVIKRIGVQVK